MKVIAALDVELFSFTFPCMLCVWTHLFLSVLSGCAGHIQRSLHLLAEAFQTRNALLHMGTRRELKQQLTQERKMSAKQQGGPVSRA